MIKSEWFEKKLYNRREVYLPNFIIDFLKLKGRDTLAILIKVDNRLFTFPTYISLHHTYSGISVSFRIPSNIKKNLNSKIVFMKIIKLKTVEPIKNLSKNYLDISQIANKNKSFMVTNWINKNYVIIWDKPKGKPTHRPIIVHNKLKLNNELLTYLGLYFSDGNKKGDYEVCASTKELAKLILSLYRKIIKNQNLGMEVNFNKSVLDKRPNDKIKNILIEYWKEFIPLQTIKRKIKIFTRRPKAIHKPKNHSEYGVLRISDGRELTRYLHTLLIKTIIDKYKDNKNMLESFFRGAMLGDGCPTFRPRVNRAFNWLSVGTNKKEIGIWRFLCSSLNLKYLEKPKKGEGMELAIHGYFTIVNLLKNGLFDGFQKRKNKLIKGLRNRIETYIFQSFINNSYKSLKWKDEFLRRTNSFFIVNKGGDLISNNLMKFDRNNVILTKKGEKFINVLSGLNLVR